MPVKKIVTWAVVLFIAYYLFTQPTGAGHAMHSLLNGLKSAGNSLATFISSL